MITARECEDLAQHTIQEYVNACRCGSTQDICNVLMKLASMSGLAMVAVGGLEEAIERMRATTDRIAAAERETEVVYVRHPAGKH